MGKIFRTMLISLRIYFIKKKLFLIKQGKFDKNINYNLSTL